MQLVSNPAADVPLAPGNPIATSNPGLAGFNGLTHRDQRLAGTGAYANTQFSLEPPDQGLCVGSGFVLEAINTALTVFDTTGTRLTSPTALNQFFGLSPEVIRSNPRVFGDFSSDPRCYFDPSTSRWFFSLLEIDTVSSTGAFGTSARQLLAVSQSSDPTKSWFLYSFSTTDDGTNGTPSNPGCPCFGDQPYIGADAKGFYITTNEFSISGPNFNGAQLYAMSKSGLESGFISNLQHLQVPSYNLPGDVGPSFTVQPAIVPPGGSFAPNTEYFLASLQLQSATDNRIALWALTGTDSLDIATPTLTLSMAVVSTETYGGSPSGTVDAVQKNGPTPLGSSVQPAQKLEFLATDDDRMQQAVFADGKLWAGLTTVVKTANGGTTSGIAYFVVSPSFEEGVLSGTIANQGYVSVNQEDVMYPSIGVTSDGRGVMTFTLSGSDFFPSAAYVFVDATHGAGAVHIAGAGAVPDDGFTGYPAFSGAPGREARWGDYSAAVAGPDGKVWFAAEFIPGGPRTTFANWGTFVGSVSF